MNNTTNSWEERYQKYFKDNSRVGEVDYFLLGKTEDFIRSLLHDTEREAREELLTWKKLRPEIMAAIKREEDIIKQAKADAREEIGEKISHLKRWVATIRDGENPACDEYVVRDKELKEILSLPLSDKNK